MTGRPPLDPGLHVVAVPIGNARDITLRALDVLAEASAIACEDTRVTRRLLSLHGIPAGRRLVSYNDHNARARIPGLVRRIADGEAVALASDAGTPLVSDPGFRLVAAAQAAGLPVRAVPGASALTAALSVAGQPTDRVLFLGFLPRGRAARRKALQEVAPVPAALVVFERASRLASLLAELAESAGPREATVLREISKLHEEAVRGEPAELARRYAEEPPKGEVVVVAGPPRRAARTPGGDVDERLLAALGADGPSRAAAKVAEATGLSRSALYERALALSRKGRAGRNPAR